MDAVKFIKERNRMCTTYTPKRCEGCPADNYGEEGAACIMVDKIDAERLVPIVEEWAAAHPRKTWQSVFMEQFPNVELDRNGIINISPCKVDLKQYPFNGKNCCKFQACSECRRKFWMQEVE